MKFIAWSTQPKPQAAIANEIPYGPVNQKAFEFISAQAAGTCRPRRKTPSAS